MRREPETEASDAYARALQLRAELDATPRAGRTRELYGQTLNAFRAVYHADHAAPNAAASVEAVAELLAEEGRAFGDAGLLHGAVEQLEFLQRDFGASRFAAPALLTQGEIDARDLHDAEAARERFASFLQRYGRSPLAGQAESELRRLDAPPSASAAGQSAAEDPDYGVVGDAPPAPITRHKTRVAQAPVVRESEPEEAGENGGVVGATAGAQEARPYPMAGNPPPPAKSQLREQDVPYTGTSGGPNAPSSAGMGGPAPADGGGPQRKAAGAGAGTTQRALPDTLQPARVLSGARGGVPVYRREPGEKLATVTGMRHWSTSSYTRVAIDVGDEVPFEASRVSNPDRIFFDLHGARLAPELAGQAVTVTDGGFLQRIGAAQFSGDVVRVVLDVSDVSDYSAFWLPNPSRLIVDIHGRPRHVAPAPALIASGESPGGADTRSGDGVAAGGSAASSAPSTAASRAATEGAPVPRAARAAAPGTFVAETTPAGSVKAAAPPARSSDSMAAIAALSQQPSRVRATAAPTTAPVAAVTPGADQTGSTGDVSVRKKTRRAVGSESMPAPVEVARAAEPDSTGGRSMVRALGLKINRIVVDAGHGGHDSGTLGPGGIEEKDVVLDVALRLGKLLKQRLGADVIYTRDDDTFIPLETRTAIANKAQADLFISVHANSSPDASARGVETYYLNFTTSADALEVAARENAVSDESIHQLSDLVKKITLQDKIAESREFATDVQGSLYGGLEAGNAGLKDRGVKKAPFAVLIGANMPSILAEISFLTNPDDAAKLRDGAYRERIAEALYAGVARYVRSLSGAHLEESAAAH